MQLQPVRTVDRDDEQIRLRRTGDRLDPAVQDPVDDVDRRSNGTGRRRERNQQCSRLLAGGQSTDRVDVAGV
ncbi:Uncharacterised protein [Mycobacteroides abscessus subsp. abscessus]|nr:Uncharacterised protein [Mycobacteroides abscessus subsp. abscessus]